MFSEDNEDWESSAFQDAFIDDYFVGKTASSRGGKQNFQNKNKKSSQISSTTNEFETQKTANEETSLDHKKLSMKKKNIENATLKEKNLKKKKKRNKKDLKTSVKACSTSLKKEKKIKLNDNHLSSEERKVDLLDTSLQNEASMYSEDNVEKPNSNHSEDNKNKIPENKAFQKLQAAKFRYLNEKLYTNTGQDALKYFKENTDEFEDYHLGYQLQVAKWPLNPVDVIIKDLKKRKNISIIADLGCGEAKIAEELSDRTVYSFDLIALKYSVIACDMAAVPLPGKSVDAVVFCLSLMGTNWKDYLMEGYRILKLNGLLKIAEIESRINDTDKFIKSIEQCGFSLINKNLSRKMFVFLSFKKIKRNMKASKVNFVTLRPCLYKKR